jgi:hypothetical protein
MSRLPHFLHSRLKHGSKVVNIMRRPHFKPPGRSLVLIPVGGSVIPKTITWLGRLGELKKKQNDLIGNRTRDLSVCSIIQSNDYKYVYQKIEYKLLRWTKRINRKQLNEELHYSVHDSRSISEVLLGLWQQIDICMRTNSNNGQKIRAYILIKYMNLIR